MYSQFKQREANPMEKYIGRLARCCGEQVEVVGYSYREHPAVVMLIVDSSADGGWTILGPNDVIRKECKCYWYVSITDLID